MNQLLLRLIQVQQCRNVGKKRIRQLLRIDPELDTLENDCVSDLMQYCSFTERQAKQLLNEYHLIDGGECLQTYKQAGIKVISLGDDAYPPLLREIYDPPILLYTAGNIELLQSRKMLAVVGTRQPSAEADAILNTLLPPIIESGWTIVSGLACGIDGMAHQLALMNQTIAVLGSGLFHPYPRQHHSLFSYMCRHQLVISEYPPEAKPERWRFPERNRIISGLSLGTLVVEARVKSGSLITADQALEQGREVFAVPGSLLNPNSGGTHALIQQGAKLVTQASDILEELSLEMT
ncbi:DNA-processing protein DprA [Sporolactobacillus spathodeae]|uniref:DNA processing protein n=1 Tax=Sporolactobacillus spathodeae TaxID=1465502 RepID=A0ABS2Q7H7_9BACL|nr:DNA-processing protein DprA [Sporolactobacillus spathodeae]MBM7656937.1 DNA processing protein [Sporolactobacillus spathodeae]